MLKVSKYYMFTAGQIKQTKGQLQIIFDRNSEIKEVEDDEDIVAQGFCFSTIDEVNDFEQMRTVDMIGIVHSVNPIQSILIKSSNANKDRRYIAIVDEGGSLIQVSLWGKNARDYDLSEG